MQTAHSILRTAVGRFILVQSLMVFLAGQTMPPAPTLAPVHEVLETYFGREISDPYRYMEEGTPEATTWIRQQAAYSETVLAALPERYRLRERLRDIDQQLGARLQWVTELPHQRYLYSKSLPKDDIDKLYIRQGFTGHERLLVDPGKFRQPGGPAATMQAVYPSHDGSLVAYAVSIGNSERATLHVMDSILGEDVEKPIESVLSFASIDWSENGRCFFYRRLPPLSPGASEADRYLNSAVYRHAIGQDPSRDRLVVGPSADAPLQTKSTYWPSVNLPT
jgi:prolyl oligopeptidase